MKPVRVLLVGAKGRMGQAIAAAAEGANAVIAAALDQGDDLAKEIGACDVVIDFSHPSATDAICQVCLSASKPLVVGTTGHSDDERALLEKVAKSLPVVFSPNFSVGVNALFWLTRKAAELLGPDFDLEIMEMHHRMKKDAPSGTAVTKVSSNSPCTPRSSSSWLVMELTPPGFNASATRNSH